MIPIGSGRCVAPFEPGAITAPQPVRQKYQRLDLRYGPKSNRPDERMRRPDVAGYAEWHSSWRGIQEQTKPNAGPGKGQIAGYTKPQLAIAHQEAERKAMIDLETLIEALGEEDIVNKFLMGELLKIVHSPGAQREKLTAISKLLEFRKAKPAAEVSVTKAESHDDWAKALAEITGDK